MTHLTITGAPELRYISRVCVCVCVCAKHSVRCEYQHAPTEHRCYCRLTHLIRDAKAESEEMSVTVPEPEERELIQQRAGIRCE